MKIAINASILDNRPTGLGIYTINVVSRIASIALKEGNELEIYTSCPEVLGISEDSSKVKINKIPAIVQPKYGKKAGFARLIWNWFSFTRDLGNVDIAYCTTHHGLSQGHIKQIITIHDLLPVKFPTQHCLQNWYFTHILPYILKSSVAVITVSENSRSDLHQFYNIALNKIHVVYNGIDHNQFRALLPNEYIKKTKEKYGIINKYILIVGATYPHKNISRALQAFTKVSLDLYGIVLGGKKKYVNTLKAEAVNLGVNKCVKFLEYIPIEEIPAFYSGATALIYPSLYEGFGLPPLEAMACGCPVIVSNTSSLPEVCGDAAYYVDPYSTESIAEAICRVAGDENLRNHLRQKGLERAKLFTWDKTAKGVYEVLKTVYREHNR